MNIQDKTLKLIENEMDDMELYYTVDEYLTEVYHILVKYHSTHINDKQVQNIILKLETISKDLKNRFYN